MVGNFDEVVNAYEEAHEHHILNEFEKLLFRDGVGETIKKLGEESQWALVRYFGGLK